MALQITVDDCIISRSGLNCMFLLLGLDPTDVVELIFEMKKSKEEAYIPAPYSITKRLVGYRAYNMHVALFAGRTVCR